MIAENTRILVQNEGYIPVKTVVDRSCVLWDGEKLIVANVTNGGSQPLFNIELTNGKEIQVTNEQGFKTMQKRVGGSGWTSTENLINTHDIYFNGKVFDFDYLNLSRYTYLKNLTSEQAGILIGFVHCIKSGLYLDIPKNRRGVIQNLDGLLNLSRAPWNKEEYFKRTSRFRYILDKRFWKELKDFEVTEKLPEAYWTSRPFMRGFLKSLFTFGIVGKEMFTIRARKDSIFLKEIQEYLNLFGINASYTQGLKMSQLIILGGSCYRFANDIGVFNSENLLTGVDFKKVLMYKDNTVSDMRYGSVRRISKVGPENVCNIEADVFMAGGLILGKL